MKALLALVLGGLLWPTHSGAAATPAPSPGSGLALLTNFSSLRQLSPSQANRGYPVCVEGVVTYFDPVWGALFVQDSTAGIWIEYGPAPPALRQGQRVQVEGISRAGSFAPILQASGFVVLGPGVEPAVPWLELKDLLSGSYDSQWVGFKGTVCGVAQEGRSLTLWVDTIQGDLKAYILDWPTNALAWPWIDAEVSLRGVCGTGFNQLGQLVSVHLLVPDLAHVAVVKPGPADVFGAPVQPIRSLLRFNPFPSGQHLVHLCGSLTWQRPGEALVIQQKGDALYVETKQAEPLTLGAQVEVVGFVAVGGYTPKLVNGHYRKRGPGHAVRALPARVSQIIQNQILDDTLDSQLICLPAVLTSRTEGAREEILLLRADGQDFTAILQRDESNRPRSDGFGLRHLRQGSLLELTGVCFQRLDANHYIRSFELQLRNPADVRVLKAASWWTARRLAVAFAVSLLTSLGGLLLVLALRAQVRAKTRQISRQLDREKTFTLLGARLGSASNQLDAARVLVQATHELIGCQAAALWLTKAEQRTCLQRVLAQSAREGMMADLEGSSTELALCARDVENLQQARLITGPPCQPLEVQLASEAGRPGESRSTMIAPLRERDELFGVLVVQSGALRQYSPPDLQTLEALAAYARASLERVRMQAQLALKQKELVETSRAAGMAEVASSVLHNVGNVLSAVNVTSSLLSERIRHSKVGGLQKVAALLAEHRANPGAFITEDARGKELPGYLCTLAERLARERDENVAELASLRRDMTHIKEIIARQQSYARIGGVREMVTLSEVVEDALRINAASLERHRIEVVRQYAQVPEIHTEKHKILQILVNLVSNAKQALQAAAAPDKRLVVRLEVLGTHRAKISVSDNGMGIADQNRKHIFELGFTTRAQGHGFGLHNCALLARELGGALTFQSEGPGRGACFMLELPVDRPERKSCRTPPRPEPVC